MATTTTSLTLEDAAKQFEKTDSPDARHVVDALNALKELSALENADKKALASSLAGSDAAYAAKQFESKDAAAMEALIASAASHMAAVAVEVYSKQDQASINVLEAFAKKAGIPKEELQHATGETFKPALQEAVRNDSGNVIADHSAAREKLPALDEAAAQFATLHSDYAQQAAKALDALKVTEEMKLADRKASTQSILPAPGDPDLSLEKRQRAGAMAAEDEAASKAVKDSALLRMIGAAEEANGKPKEMETLHNFVKEGAATDYAAEANWNREVLYLNGDQRQRDAGMKAEELDRAREGVRDPFKNTLDAITDRTGMTEQPVLKSSPAAQTASPGVLDSAAAQFYKLADKDFIAQKIGGDLVQLKAVDGAAESFSGSGQVKDALLTAMKNEMAMIKSELILFAQKAYQDKDSNPAELGAIRAFIGNSPDGAKLVDQEMNGLRDGKKDEIAKPLEQALREAIHPDLAAKISGGQAQNTSPAAQAQPVAKGPEKAAQTLGA